MILSFVHIYSVVILKFFNSYWGNSLYQQKPYPLSFMDITWLHFICNFCRPRGRLELAICVPAHGATIGAWVGAWPIPLDWDRPWQVRGNVVQLWPEYIFLILNRMFYSFLKLLNSAINEVVCKLREFEHVWYFAMYLYLWYPLLYFRCYIYISFHHICRVVWDHVVMFNAWPICDIKLMSRLCDWPYEYHIITSFDVLIVDYLSSECWFVIFSICSDFLESASSVIP